MGSSDSSANETSDTEIDERQKVNRRKTQKVEYKPDYETGKIFVDKIVDQIVAKIDYKNVDKNVDKIIDQIVAKNVDKNVEKMLAEMLTKMLTKFSYEKVDNKNKTRIAISQPIEFAEWIAAAIAAI